MPRTIEGALRGQGRQFALVVSRFNSFITAKLLDGALDALHRHGVPDDDVTVVRVPGSFELALVAKKLAATRQYHAVICLGAVIRGATPHFDHICAAAARGISTASLETGVPIAFGVLTVDTVDQAIERAGTKSGNKGFEAAATALEMADLLAEM